MAKKRKGSGQPYGSGKAGKGDESKLKLDTWEDVADSEDEFHMNRDKILLDEGPEAKRRRKAADEDAFLEQSDEEILGYEESSDDDDEAVDYDEEYYDEEEEEASEKPKGAKGKKKAAEEEQEEDLGGWGPSKSDYYNADAIETEQDALDEEAEALRIQKLQLQRMSAADFGLDDEEEESSKEDEASDQEEEEDEQVVTEVLPQPKLTKDVGTEERLKILHERYPEFDHLRRDLLELHPRASELKLLAEATLRTRSTTQLAQKQPMAVVKWRALTAYLGAITMYFALLTSTYGKDAVETITAMHPQQLHNHPVMDSLLRCRDVWNQVKDLPIDDVDGTELSVIEEELDAVSAEEASADNLDGATTNDAVRKPVKKSKSKAQRRLERAQAEEQAQQEEKARKLEEELAQLSGLTTQEIRRKVAKANAEGRLATFDDESDLGEETRLTEEALDEKAKRKRSLKFYTSQIAQKANKRTAAGRDYGGDIDVPHKERLRDRQARLNAEAEKRGRKTQAADEELGGESDEEDHRQAREIRGEAGSDSDDLYEQVVARNKKRKLDDEAFSAAKAQAALEGGRVVEAAQIGPDGKRKITYEVEKNKGLTPFRKKENRNPRTKKRRQFADKQKKLASIRQIYKGNLGNSYGGEATGIKKGIVRSIKLS